MLDVAITGLGIVSALGVSVEEFHHGLLADASGIRPAPWPADGGRFTHTSNTDEPDPDARFEVVIGGPRAMDYATLQVNAFGFGGQNASVVVTRS